MNVMSPFAFKDWLNKQRPYLANGGPINIFGAQFETEVEGAILSYKSEFDAPLSSPAR